MNKMKAGVDDLLVSESAPMWHCGTDGTFTLGK